MTSRRLLGCWELRLDFFTTRGAPGAGFVTPEWRGAEREAPPAQRAGRAEPRAEAAGRCPGKKGNQPPRPERPREFPPQSAQLSVHLLAAFQAAGLRGLLTQGIGLRPQPWAGLSRPVGPDGTDQGRSKAAGSRSPETRTAKGRNPTVLIREVPTVCSSGKRPTRPLRESLKLRTDLFVRQVSDSRSEQVCSPGKRPARRVVPPSPGGGVGMGEGARE